MYEAKAFTIPELSGISEKTITEHLGLYRGYVKHTNVALEQVDELSKDPERNGYALAEVRRRLGFEFDGMRIHERYFEQFEGGARELPEGKLAELFTAQYGGFENWLARFELVTKTRGVGWAMLYFDPAAGWLLEAWVDEHQLGQLAELPVVLALDMWEHAFMLDYPPSEKAKYIDAFFKNVNWEVAAGRVQ